MDYRDISEIKDIKTSGDEHFDIVNGEICIPKKKSIEEVNKYLKKGWVLLGISYTLSETGSKIDYYVLGKTRKK